MQRRLTDVLVWREELIKLEQDKRAQGRPKKTWMKVIRQDIEAKGLDKGILLDRNEWRKMIHVPDTAQFSFGSCSLPQIRETNGLVVIVVEIEKLESLNVYYFWFIRVLKHANHNQQSEL